MPEVVVERLDCRPGMKPVDLGAGTGYFVGYLSESVGGRGRVLALHADRAMVEAMQARIEREGLRNVEPGLIAADDPGLPPRSVDRILIVNTWHHISNRVAYAEKLLAALGPGGQLLIVDFTIESPHGPPPQMRLTDDTVQHELEAAGFEAELVEAPLPYQYLVAGRLP
ncbi:MAG: methyltransferase domain-containing protein [Deltaproteobacteria bacterium]|nr:methyltransferase domain-containing protein [Deltaproteobacteria bacterium]